MIAGAGVCEFSAEIEGRHIVGIVKKAEEAQRDYDEAIHSGHSALLLEEKLPDVFKVSHSFRFRLLIFTMLEILIEIFSLFRQKLATWRQVLEPKSN